MKYLFIYPIIKVNKVLTCLDNFLNTYFGVHVILTVILPELLPLAKGRLICLWLSPFWTTCETRTEAPPAKAWKQTSKVNFEN